MSRKTKHDEIVFNLEVRRAAQEYVASQRRARHYEAVVAHEIVVQSRLTELLSSPAYEAVGDTWVSFNCVAERLGLHQPWERRAAQEAERQLTPAINAGLVEYKGSFLIGPRVRRACSAK